MIEPYHHTGRAVFAPLNPKHESFADFLDKYDLELDRIKLELGKVSNEIVGIEIPEGLKKFTHDLISYLSKKLGTKLIISGDSCFGACDIKYYQFETLNIHKIIHFGNVAIGNRQLPKGFKIIFVPLYLKIDVTPAIIEAISYLKSRKIKKVGLISSIQYIKNVPKIRNALTMEGIEVYTAKGTDRLAFDAQILGCNPSAASRIKAKVQKFIMIEGGGFHALPVALSTKKDVWCFDPLSGKTFIYEYKRLRKLHLNKLTALKKSLLKGKRVGFIVSNKLGQSRKEILTNLQDEFIKKGYSTGVIVVDFLNINSINCMDFDILVSTICPRVALDERAQYSRPILSTVEALEFIKKPDSFDKKFTFDQIL